MKQPAFKIICFLLLIISCDQVMADTGMTLLSVPGG